MMYKEPLMGLFFLLLSVLPGFAGSTQVSVEGEHILINGRKAKLIGLRCSNALISDTTAHDLLDSLDLYQSYGLNTFSVFLMGSRFGDVKGYLPDGALNPVYRDRLESVLRAADERGMVVIVGCLYWGTSRASEDLKNWSQHEANTAIASTARWLKEKGFTHVILDPDNEGMAHRALRLDVESCIQAAKDAYPDLLVANNTKMDPPNEDLNMHFGKAEPGKPWLDSEATPDNAPWGYWGRFSKETHQKGEAYSNYSRIGRYTEEMKALQMQRTRDEIDRHSGHILASTWVQCAPTEGVGGPFTQPGGTSDLGSSGDVEGDWNRDIDQLHSNAGILWWLEFVNKHWGPGRATIRSGAVSNGGVESLVPFRNLMAEAARFNHHHRF